MSDGRGGTKVARVIDKYDLSGIGAQLETAWTAESGERTSLRDLADEFNQRVLEGALREADVSLSTFEVAGTYNALRHGSGSEETRARRRLEREGVDVEALTADFVTHQAVHTYLTKEREASLPERDGDAVEQKIETIEKLQGRVAAVTETAIDSLGETEQLDRAEYNVIVDVRVVCSECGSDHSVGELLQQGGCECAAGSE